MKDLLLKHKKPIIATAFAIAAIAIYYLLTSSNKANFQMEKVVEVEIVKPSSIRQQVDVIGTIKASKKAILTASSKGVLEILSNSGQIVKKGDLIAKIVNDDVEKNYLISKEAAEIAQTQFDRINSLLQSGVVSKSSVDEKRTTLLDTQKRLSDAKIALELLKMHAPFDGTVGFFKFRDGAEVKAGDTIVTFYDPEFLIVEFDLPPSIAQQLGDGAPVFIRNQEYKLTHVQKMLDEETHMCPAYAEIHCQDCIIGTSVDVSVVAQSKDNVIVIPFEAIFLKNSKPFVYTVKDNKAALTPIELGIRDKQLIEIKSGLKEGDQLIVQGHLRLYPNASVKIHS